MRVALAALVVSLLVACGGAHPALRLDVSVTSGPGAERHSHRQAMIHPLRAAPAWLVRAERTLLARTFGGARPERVDYIPYPKKIAVVFTFSRVVVCGGCSAPSAASQPRGRIVRVSFDRSTHTLGGAPDGWAMQFCSERARARCFHL